jgi:hypothetical protein
MNLVKTISTRVDNLGMRLVKFFRFGKSDVQEVSEVSPFGLDSNPIKDMVAVYAKTADKGDAVIVGYLNKNRLAEIGEFRIYSTNAQGEEQIYIHLKNDGTAQIGGTGDNLVRYKPVEDLVSEINQFLNQQLPLIASGIATGGGAYTPGVANFNISDAKIDELETTN